MVEPVTERLAWAAEVIDVAPDDRVLEIGCGNGALVSAICERLDSGAVTAIDRSEKMIHAALRRNSGHVASGKAHFLADDLAAAHFGFHSFTKIVAFNVGLFWRSHSEELARVRQWLAPGGNLFLFYQPPTDEVFQGAVERLVRWLKSEGYSVRDTAYLETEPARAVCVRAEPA